MGYDEWVMHVLVNPISVVALILLAGFLFCVRKRKKKETLFLAFVLISLVPPSLPVLAKAMIFQLEGKFPGQKIQDYPVADAIVLLGGTISPVTELRKEPGETFGNRCLRAAQLYHQKKARQILVTGGHPYGEEDRTEASDLKEILTLLGIPPEHILVENQARTTKENASYCAEIAKREGIRSILLVTNGFHLKRATYWFTQVFPTVIPVPAEQLISHQHTSWQDFIPTVPAIFMSMIAIRELGASLLAR